MPRNNNRYPAPERPSLSVDQMANLCRDEPTGTVLASSLLATFVKVDGGVEARFCDGQVKFMAETGWS